MNKNFLKHFVIGLILFLLGYFSFNRKLFGTGEDAPASAPASQAVQATSASSGNP